MSSGASWLSIEDWPPIANLCVAGPVLWIAVLTSACHMVRSGVTRIEPSIARKPVGHRKLQMARVNGFRKVAEALDIDCRFSSLMPGTLLLSRSSITRISGTEQEISHSGRERARRWHVSDHIWVGREDRICVLIIPEMRLM